ncbi:hypothetical protein VFPBJ_11689 [Purpureocillium lilacinum]|uniref:Uncharacterized protein n=1 Tax=Purpureocillium lilacinum TaxID=33203 RepID=A0A179EYX5_PURLI|nr:hypothetical protein VFPBJ_11689 [Purpureocillium lilacinum]
MTDGLKCKRCRYISRQIQKIQAHCRKAHNRRNPRIKCRPSSNNTPPLGVTWTGNVHCQRFLRWGAGSEWFEVDRKSGRKKAPDTSGSRVMALPVYCLAPEVSGHLRGALKRRAGVPASRGLATRVQ